MTKEQILQFIKKHPLIFSPNTTEVITKEKTYYGFFQDFHDYMELQQENKWRFIPNENAIAFQKEHGETKINNPVHSIIINAGDITSISLKSPTVRT